MTIETKYSIGDKVYIPYCEGTTEIKTVCPACKGEKIKEFEGFTFICNNCNEGYMYSYKYIYYPRRTSIGQIHLVCDKNSNEITYMLKATGVGSGSLWKESELFDTEEECQKTCDEYNNKE